VPDSKPASEPSESAGSSAAAEPPAATTAKAMEPVAAVQPELDAATAGRVDGE